jgi:hypothetical protein
MTKTEAAQNLYDAMRLIRVTVAESVNALSSDDCRALVVAAGRVEAIGIRLCAEAWNETAKQDAPRVSRPGEC